MYRAATFSDVFFIISFTISVEETNAIHRLHTRCATGLLSVHVLGTHSFTVGEDRNFDV